MRALVCLLLVACWHEVELETPRLVPVIEPTGPAPVRRVDTPYRDVAGTWRGIGFQYDDKSQWAIEMTVFARGNIGDVVGFISYPSLGCTADLIRQVERGDTLAMTERLITGQGKCVDGGTIRIPRRTTGHEMEWRWDFANGTEGASSALLRD